MTWWLVAIGLVWVALTVYTVALALDVGRLWVRHRRRAQRLTEDALRYYEHRQLQLRVRPLIEDERRRLQAAAQTGRPR